MWACSFFLSLKEKVCSFDFHTLSFLYIALAYFKYLYGRIISRIVKLIFVYLQYIGLGRGSYSDFLLQRHRVGSTHNHGQLQQIPQQMS